jgi:PAS domain S-box-containing protein
MPSGIPPEALPDNKITKDAAAGLPDSGLAPYWLSAIIESAEDAIVSKTLDGIITSWNKGAEHIFGYTADEVIGKPVNILIPPDHSNEEPAILARLRRGERIEHYETVRVRKDGTLVAISLTVSPIRGPEGQIIGASKIARDITEKKRTEEALRRREEELTDFIENSTVGLHWVGADGSILWANQAELDLLGYTREEYIGRHIAEFHADEPVIGDILHRLMNREALHDYEARLRCKDGSTRHVLINSNVMWEGDTFIHTRCFTRDITERKRAEVELHESRRQLEVLLASEQAARAEAERQRDFTRRVLEDAPLAIGVMEGADHRFVIANRQTCELTGLSEEQFLGRPHREVVPDADTVVGPILDRVYTTGLSETDEIDVDLPKGRRQLLVTWTALPGRDGGPRSVLYLSLDITERKRVEAALRESEWQLRTMADAVPQLVWMAGPDGHIFWYNQRWYDYTGTTPAEMEGWGWESVHDPEMLPRVAERWRASLETGEPFEMEFPLKGADGVFRWFLTRVNPLRDSQGRIVQWFGTNTDVDEQRRTAHQLREANRLKDEFLATVSHELRTPLTAVLGWAHLLRGGQLDEKSARGALETIERNARAQSQLIDDLLDVSRIITGKLRLDVRQVDPSSFIESAIEALRPAAEAKDIRIQKVMDTGLLSVAGDPARLQQVVWNLLSNALKFTPKGGRVQVRLERINSHIEIAVSDTGVGIKPEFLPHVFERFRQADQTTTRHHGGLGLGLAIVRHLVELHGGTVQVESPGEGQGATFVVKLPVVPIYRKENLAERVHPSARETLPSYECPDRLDGLKVLVVDDEADARELLRVGIGQCGAKVTTASSVQEALEAIEKEKPDILISDIGMPVEDGYELIRRVRALPAESGGKIPAIALTAYARTEDRLQALRAGYQMHLPKPVEMAELVAVAASLIQRGN